MRFYLNKQPTELSSEASLYAILEASEMHNKKGIAVAVNNEVINKTAWTSYTIKEADKITIITATQGG